MLLFLLLLLPQAACGMRKAKCILDLDKDELEPLNYYRPGDHLISAIIATRALFQRHTFTNLYAYRKIGKAYRGHRYILPILLAIQEVNKNPGLLQNVTLGYNIYNNFFDGRLTYDSMVDMLSAGRKNIPNYSCGRENSPSAVIEGTDSEISIHISTMLSNYKVPQVSFASVSRILSDKTRFPFFYWTLPKEETLHLRIVQLLLHFRWTWIGLIAPDTDSGEMFLRTLTPQLLRNSVCVAFSLNVPGFRLENPVAPMTSFPQWRQINVVVYYGQTRQFYDAIFFVRIADVMSNNPIMGKVWITTALWDLTFDLTYGALVSEGINGFFSFLIQTQKRTKYDNRGSFLSDTEKFGEKAFDCSYSKHALSAKGQTRCKEKEKLETLPQDLVEKTLSQDSYSLSNTIWAVAHTLNAAYSARSERREMVGGDQWEVQRIQPWQVFLDSRR